MSWSTNCSNTSTTTTSNYIYFSPTTITVKNLYHPTMGSTGRSLVSIGAPGPRGIGDIKASDKDSFTISLPDGSKFVFDQGKYRIEDKDAKVTYRANSVREFNRFVNASDLIVEFLSYCKDLGAMPRDPRDVLKFPLELFVAFLVVKAAEADAEPVPQEEVLMLESRVPQLAALPPPEGHRSAAPRCLCCGRYTKKRLAASGIRFCSPEHATLHATNNGGW